MKKIARSVLTAAALSLLCGCISEAERNIENSKKLRVGMTKVQVLKIMGDPVEEEFNTPDLWYYFVKSVWADGLTTEEECMPLVFQDGRLIGWGNRFYNDYHARLIEKHKTVPVISGTPAKKGK